MREMSFANMEVLPDPLFYLVSLDTIGMGQRELTLVNLSLYDVHLALWRTDRLEGILLDMAEECTVCQPGL